MSQLLIFIAVVTLWLVLYMFLLKSKAWLMAYSFGAIGFALISIYYLRGSEIEAWVERISAFGAHILSGAMGIPTKVFLDAPGTLLVLVVYQKVGWTAIEIDIECSGVLEFTVFTALILFFNGFTWRYRLTVLPLGLLATFFMNLIRIVVIVATIHFGGKSSIYIAHTVLGRAIFFLMVIALYWYVFTRATHDAVRERLMEEQDA